ncbi:hypothetical protein Kisp01_26960 [Kineosporia sp. NBRC 101677]|uniref:Hsp70 family protein n=1 Tax=Kineosporia sp. NBRC 101677 TaxID=3032197 RepID=UPI0024A11C09|nr:Hsp70 family protein [Kineosporia sp. NBRC 101677]GLY15681.1 hypothetical protein Kisp01_26960 [Kineosporia sp. NBRC 101677]
MSYGLGIDLGTVVTRAAVSDGRTAPLSLPGGAPISAVLKEVTAGQGARPGHVVITCRATWGPRRREQLAEICRETDLHPDGFSLRSEPEAVAMAYLSGQPPRTPGPLVIYDAGGSSFDACVIDVVHSPDGQVTVRELGVPESMEWFGGVDLDRAVLSRVDRACSGAVSQLDPGDPDEARTLERIRAAAVRAKEALAVVPQTEIEVALPGRSHSVMLTRLHLQEWLRPQLAAALPALRQVLDSARIGRSDPATVLLSGGTAQIPVVGQMLAESLGREVVLLPDPQTATALGAALLADQQR